MTGTRKGMTGTRKGMTGTGHQTTANPDFASGQFRISPMRLPGFLRFSQPDFPDKSGFRTRTSSDIRAAIALTFLHQASGFSGQIRISHPDKFGYPQGDCPDFSAFHIRIFLKNPGNHLGYIRKNPENPDMHK